MIQKNVIRLFYAAVIFAAANIYTLPVISGKVFLVLLTLAFFIFINIMPSPCNRKLPTRRLKACGNGYELLILFLMSTAATSVYVIIQAFHWIPGDVMKLIIHAVIAIIVEACVFWNGIIRVYTTSVQLGIRWRVIGILCGWIPIAHLVALIIIIYIVSEEVHFEAGKIYVDSCRKEEKICQTKYPLLMVHGVFFRDFEHLNYWGRIPEALEKNGAKIYYGNHQSAASVENSAKELAKRIQEVIKESGAEKVNLIAHSKGGLDCRYALSELGAAPFVASLTTINTPHRGCLFADYLLEKIPEGVQNSVAGKYNMMSHKLGDENPDFIAAVTDLRASVCETMNEKLSDVPGIYCQSVGSGLGHAVSGKFPLNFSYRLVKHFDGANDGLVAATSFSWGENYTYLTAKGHRGISHGDMIDLNRENIKGFDVREFYVNLVADLKSRGL